MIGCSSFTLESQDNKHFLSRTMDFQIEMAEQILFIPRNKEIGFAHSNEETIETSYACLGMGVMEEGHPVLFDGINEKGLMGATLYFPGYADYSENIKKNQKGISPDMVIPTVLTQASNLEEIIDLFDKKFVIINDTNPTLGLTPPLHFIFSDSSGQSLIIEPRQGGLSIIKDSIGVMTNSPDYQWHETNLRNYLSFTPNQKESIELLGKTLKPFSQGSGTFGFPGDFTPPSRFVRTAYLKNYAEKPSNELAAITLCHHILESVSIPKGIVITEHGASDFTCYSAYMCSETLSYYFSTYGNQRIRKISLSESLKNEKEFKNFPIVNEEDILELN
ncbi:linear amide C-N hydrolase [Lactococcus lactis subsp. lactis]|uniref:choloylglycine hydrolase family protein n=1 Tax=Lactococcus lactis TaxID=1358 RepID=UPI0007AEC728|nr:linear amide C-N hydrolase [Lactococcus lactis]ARD94310.1 penicillin acylase [Lactococcus lactis subsp. lactis]KZK14464.1 Choloylglycine hydrolase [Lactococcus lactis subsp. lactis bv. diacetylactis]MCT3103516.1 linear amide C-N hydrolase [Lactococcus lactis]MRL66461.1 linear amide C-N hydrolase [Lactococcus lactis subsp. lactis]QTP11504.1 linear amide C-N hydrolase [Lactococcus lactis subsp. lactis]